MRKTKVNIADFERVDELWAPYEAMRPLFDIEAMPPERLAAANESMMADLLGDEAKPAPTSRLDAVTSNLMYAIMELQNPAKRFDIYKVMFQHYPWRRKISKADHIQSAYYLFVHECYIFEARLKKFFNATEDFAKKKHIEIDVEQIRKETLSLHKRVFSRAIKWRGMHVHQDEFVPRQIRRVALLDTMIMASSLRTPEMKACWQALEREAVGQIRKEWSEHCDTASKAAREIIASVYTRTKAVWSVIAK